jgi:hypothetical protein
LLLESEKTKKDEFESAYSLHKNWLNFKKKYNMHEDIETLSQLFYSSQVTRTEEEILDLLWDLVLSVLDSEKQLDIEQKTRATYFSYNLCSCQACQEECGAHMNKKGQIRISKKFFHSILNQKTHLPIQLLELMYIILHQILHGIFPEYKEETIIEKSEQTWKSGIIELIKQNLNCEK